MALHRFGFIVVGAELDARQQLSSRAFEMSIVGVASPEEGPAAAAQLLAEGVQLIELCGAFGPTWTARVIDAVEGRVPVGAVSYGAEALPGLAEIFLS
jgi:hypothetical protein